MPNTTVERCGDCKLSIGNRDKFVKCSGICDGCVFHVDCTDLKEHGAAYEKLKNVGGLKWLCERCNETFNSVGLDGFMFAMIKNSVEKAVETEMVKVNTKLDNFVASQTEQRSLGSPFVRGNQRKRLREDDGNATPKPNKSYRDKLVFGTNDNAGVTAKLKGVIRPSNETPEDFKSIYLSQLDPSTEPKDITEYLTDSKVIDGDHIKLIKCVKLVSPKAITETFTYVSFKLDAPEVIFDKLVSPDTWPKSVAVREFVHKPRPTAVLTKK
jgi:ribosomal protein L31E